MQPEIQKITYPVGFARTIIVITTVSAAIMELIDTSIVNVALTRIAGNLGVSIEDMSWVITAYAIANVVIIPMTGFLQQYFGRKNYYLVSMVLFTVASYCCGASSSLGELVLWRFLQGIGGGALLSTSQGILFDAFPPEKRALAGGFFGMGIVLGPTLGPTVGGWILDNTEHWGWIFYVNIPIGILATYLTYTFIEKKWDEGKNKNNIHIDWLGIILLMAGVGCLQFTLERGETEDWFNSTIIQWTAAIATIGLILFVWRELNIKYPVVNLRVLNNRTLAITTVFTFVVGIGLFTSVYVYPVLMQRVVGWSPLVTGLSLLPPTLAGIIIFPIVGKRMSTGANPLPFVIAGFIFFIAFGFTGSDLSNDINRWNVFVPLLYRAFGISLLQLPLINASVATLKPQDYPAGIAINNMIRQLGGSFGIALSNNYINQQYAQHRLDLVTKVTTDNPVVQERIATITQGLISRTGDAASAVVQTYKSIDLSVDRQAYFLSYLDTFRMISLFFIIVFPLIFFLKFKKDKKASLNNEAKQALEGAH